LNKEISFTTLGDVIYFKSLITSRHWHILPLDRSPPRKTISNRHV